MSVDTSTFKIRFPEFDGVADARVQLFIDDADSELSESAWGEKYERAVSYLAAHLLALGQETASGNVNGLSPIASASADGLSTGFAKTAYTDVSMGQWESTSYGRELLRLKRGTFTAARVVTLQ